MGDKVRNLILGERVRFIGTLDQISESFRKGDNKRNQRKRYVRMCLRSVSVGDIKISHLWVTIHFKGGCPYKIGDVLVGKAIVELYKHTRSDGTLDMTLNVQHIKKLGE